MMGTFVTVTVMDADAARATAHIERAFEAMTAWCAEASEWESASALSRLGAAAAGQRVDLPAPLFRLLELAQRVWHDSGGAFDPSWLPLKQIWYFREQEEPPSAGAVSAALAQLGFGQLELFADPAPHAVKRSESLRLGLGAIAKGAAVDLACEALEAAGAVCFLVDAGGDIRGRNAEHGWGVGLRDGAGHIIDGSLDLRCGAIATSGSYEAGFDFAGRRYHHLLDPRTGYPASWCGGVTVIAPGCALADALATACFILGPEAGQALLRHYPRTAAAWFADDGTTVSSEGWPQAEDAVALPLAFGFC